MGFQSQRHLSERTCGRQLPGGLLIKKQREGEVGLAILVKALESVCTETQMEA